MQTPTKKQLVIYGAVFGDIIGSAYEWRRTKKTDFQLFTPRTKFTDDTVCTIAVAEAIETGRPFDEELQKWCRKYRNAGYGGSFRRWIEEETPAPYNSWGNGSAMRVSPAGAKAESMEEALELAKKSAEVTHNHPEGIKGAQATAAAIFLALHGKKKSEIKEYIEKEFGYDLSRQYGNIQRSYRFDVSCQGSVPEAIIAFLESHDYESTVRLAVALGGDADTQAAIAGGIAAAFYGSIPEEIFENCQSRLPREMIEVIEKF